MTNNQRKQYQKYIDKRCLGMPLSQYEILINIYNEVFNKSINYKEFIKEKGIIHKLGKMEVKLDKHFYSLNNKKQLI